jgi:ribosomal protein L11 methyltransferase
VLWFEITARVPTGSIEVVAELMRQVSPGGVVVDEPVDILGPERGFRVREGELVAVRAYLPSSELGAILTEQLRTGMHARFPEVELIAKPIYEQHWAVAWREFFGVVDYGGRVVIVPSWVEHDPAPGQLAIRLDPGQAFGTGHHETTRMCLRGLEELLPDGATVLDLGTGSGVLSVAAVLLGSGPVDAIDIDPVAADVARANIGANGVADRITVRSGTLSADAGALYDLVVANISTETNVGLAPTFASVVRPGGQLLLSGILGVDAPRVTASMAAAGFERRRLSFDNDWSFLAFERR